MLSYPRFQNTAKAAASSTSLFMSWQPVPKEMAAWGCHFGCMMKGGAGGGVSLGLQECCSGALSGCGTPQGKGWGGIQAGLGAWVLGLSSPPSLVPAAAALVQMNWACGEEAVGGGGAATPALVGAPVLGTGGCREPCGSVFDFGALPESWDTVG